VSRTPRPHRPGAGDQPASRVLGDPPPVELYPLRRGGRAVPDRSQPPRIGPACYDTDTVSPAASVDPDTNAGPRSAPAATTKCRRPPRSSVTLDGRPAVSAPVP
jgi:hypothetical protein